MKTVKVSGEIGPDGRLTPESIQKAMKGMLDSLDLEPEDRAEIERQMVQALTNAPLFAVSARSMIKCIERAEGLLEHLPDGMVSLAQATDVAPHIYTLGGIAEKLLLAQACLASAREELGRIADCPRSADAPEPDQETLS